MSDNKTQGYQSENSGTLGNSPRRYYYCHSDAGCDYMTDQSGLGLCLCTKLTECEHQRSVPKGIEDSARKPIMEQYFDMECRMYAPENKHLSVETKVAILWGILLAAVMADEIDYKSADRLIGKAIISIFNYHVNMKR